ncbi:MAG: sulfotransferase domain-containing protein, partial [candidate division KSB1 bacterium]
MHRTDFAQQPSVWLVGYPRSGNTWINFLCSYCLNLPFHDFDDPGAVPVRDWVRAAVAGKQAWQAPTGLHAVIKTHKFPQQVPHQDSRIIYLQRDPRDVFVSHSHFLTHRAKKGRKRHLF